MAKELGDFFGVPSNKVDVVPNGMRADHFADILAEDLTEFRARWAHPEEKLVLFVGRMVHEKGPYVLVDAVPEVLRAVPEAKFVMVGKGPRTRVSARRGGRARPGRQGSTTGFCR